MKPPETSNRGGYREMAGKPPATLRAVKYGSTRTCKKCGRFVAKTHYHECKPRRGKIVKPVSCAPAVKIILRRYWRMVRGG